VWEVNPLELPDVIETPRLRLRLLTIEEAQAMTTGVRLVSWHETFPRGDDVDAASLVVDGAASSWGPRLIVTVADGLVVGTIGFLGAPVDVAGVAEAEVGYGLVPSSRNLGLATEALAGMLAFVERLSVRVQATCAPDNLASRRVLQKCGFVLLGTASDGQLVLRRDF
jgi:ribosomal-protein-alanine N-acetyltransferase